MKTKYLAKYHTLLIAILNFLLPLIIQNTNISILREWQCLYVAAIIEKIWSNIMAVYEDKFFRELTVKNFAKVIA